MLWPQKFRPYGDIPRAAPNIPVWPALQRGAGRDDCARGLLAVVGIGRDSLINRVDAVSLNGVSVHDDVWVELKIPAVLVSKEYKAEPHTDESKNALHWNSYGCFNVEYFGKGYDKLAKADGIINDAGQTLITNMVDYNADNAWYDYKYVGEKDGYVIIRTKMQNKLPAGKISLPCLAQPYILC